MRKFFGGFVIPLFNHPSRIVQRHFAIDDFAEQTHPVLTTNGNKIQSFLCIIVSAQTYRTAVMFVGIIFCIYGHI